MMELLTVLEPVCYVLLLVYGIFLSIRFACGTLHPDRFPAVMTFRRIALCIQGIVYFSFGYLCVKNCIRY